MDGRGSFAANDFAVLALADDGSFALSYSTTSPTACNNVRVLAKV